MSWKYLVKDALENLTTAEEQHDESGYGGVQRIADGELHQLNIHQGDAELTRERYAHALTRAEMVKHAAEATALRAELDAIKAREQAAAVVRETRNEFSAATERLEKLTADIRQTHNLSDKHAIDALTGVVILPEG